MVRAKFTVQSISQNNPENPEERSSISLSPVTSGSKENEEFYKWTPVGSILLSTINEAAASQFEVGKSYYVDFSAAE